MTLTIGKRIILGFVAAVSITAGLGMYSYVRLNRIETASNAVVTDSLPGEAIAGQIEATINLNYANCVRHIIFSNDEQRVKIEADMAKNTEEITRLYAEYEPLAVSEGDRKILGEMKAARQDYIASRGEVIKLSRGHKMKEAAELLEGTLDPRFRTYSKLAHELLMFNKNHGELGGKSISDTVAAGKVGIIVGLGVAVLAAVGLGFSIIRGTNRVLKRMASGLGDGSNQVASAAGQVTGSSQSLAEGASQQAAALEETTSALEEMSSMTRKNAETAQQAASLAGEAQQSADKGNRTMSRMSTAINDIQKAASETAKIIKVIDEIAFQTNLLALNAAVEAARAGEAGKGFAVVATEVRNLAQRSAEAAKTTAQMIDESVNHAKNGVTIALDVGKNLEEITMTSTKVNTLVGEIAAAAKEQSQGIAQVNTAVSEMDKVTQSNAAAAEESASAAKEMSGQAEQMRGMVRELLVLVGGG